MNCISYYFYTKFDYKEEYNGFYFLLFLHEVLLQTGISWIVFLTISTRVLIINRYIINCISYFFYTRFDYKQEYQGLYFLSFYMRFDYKQEYHELYFLLFSHKVWL